MARELLYEESASSLHGAKESKYYTCFFVVAMIFFVLTGIQLFFSFSYLYSVFTNEELTSTGRIFYTVFWCSILLVLFGLGFLFFKVKNRFNVSYDYMIVEDELRITKVFNGKRRKFLTTVKAENILKIGWYEKPSFEATVRGLQGKKPRYVTPNKQAGEEKEFIYLLANTSLERRVYVLECRRTMLEHLVFIAGRNKLERE